MVTLAIMVMVTLTPYYGDGYLGALHTASTLVQGVLPALTARGRLRTLKNIG